MQLAEEKPAIQENFADSLPATLRFSEILIQATGKTIRSLKANFNSRCYLYLTILFGRLNCAVHKLHVRIFDHVGIFHVLKS